MMLWLVSWQYVRKHAVRSALTLMAIVIGVSVFVAMRSANAAVLASFHETINRVAGATELQVTAGDVGFNEDVLETVQAVRQVRVAAPVVEAVVGSGLADQGNLLVLGVDMTGDRSLRDYSLAAGDQPLLDDPLIFLAQPDSLIVTEAFATRNKLAINSTIPLQTMQGAKSFRVRGILKPSGLTSAFGGNLAIMDVYAAQHVFGIGRTFTRIDLAVTEGASVAEVQSELQRVLGPGFEVQPPSARGQSFESLLRIYRFLLVFSSAFALLVGMFIVYNAFGIAVAQRRNEIGLLRALGATRGQVWRLFVAESLVFGVIGSALGIGIGQAGAGVVASGVATIVQGVYGVGGSDVQSSLTIDVAMLALAVGLLTSAVATMIPARAAARVDPVVALQKGRAQKFEHHQLRTSAAIGATAMLVGLLTFHVNESLTAFYIGYGGTLGGALLLTPWMSHWLTRAIRPLLIWLRPVEGALAADGLIAASRRTSATVVALMLALAIGLAGIARTAYAAITRWVDTALNPDLFVAASPTLVEHSYRFPGTMRRELLAVPGVVEAQPVRLARVPFRGNPIVLTAIDAAATVRRSPRDALEGDINEMFRETAAGRGVIVSENLASLFNVHQGETIALPSPSGEVVLPVVGVIREYGDQQGAVFIDWSLLTERWQDDAVNFFRVYVAPGASPPTVKANILAAFASNRRIFVLENAEVRRYVGDLTNQWFSMSGAQLAVAIIVAVLGIVNSLTVSVTDRKRELGILRAVGGLRSQVRYAIWMEALGVGVLSLILGLALGALHLYGVLEMTARDFPGLRFDYMYPYSVAVALVPTILGTALLGALGPAETAVRGSLVEALEYE